MKKQILLALGLLIGVMAGFIWGVQIDSVAGDFSQNATLTLYTPEGVVTVNPYTVDVATLSKLRMSKEDLINLIPRNLPSEIDQLNIRLAQAESDLAKIKIQLGIK